MVEENTYWGLTQYRWIDNFDKLQELFEIPWIAMLFMRRIRSNTKQKLMAHGIGRHSKDDLEGIIEKDLNAISTFLGAKPYLTGDEPTEVDAAVFGQLSEIVWTAPDSYLHRIVTLDCPNLLAYCNRIKDRYWPDWDQLTPIPTNKKTSWLMRLSIFLPFKQPHQNLQYVISCLKYVF
ncbi:failed axon connections homolog [Branchiostoma lanceolatum]|uniref:failed axon connections homolog n=1 Tax=Branchiostoma lanceolatum TaxID=7740 RepID=UPI003457167B